MYVAFVSISNMGQSSEDKILVAVRSSASSLDASSQQEQKGAKQALKKWRACSSQQGHNGTISTVLVQIDVA